MLSLSDVCRSRYLLFRGLCDAGFPVARACLAVDVLLGPEPDQADQAGEPLEWRPSADQPFEPSPEDWRDYYEWSDRNEAMGRPWPAEYPAGLADEDIAVASGAVG